MYENDAARTEQPVTVIYPINLPNGSKAKLYLVSPIDGIQGNGIRVYPADPCLEEDYTLREEDEQFVEWCPVVLSFYQEHIATYVGPTPNSEKKGYVFVFKKESRTQATNPDKPFTLGNLIALGLVKAKEGVTLPEEIVIEFPIPPYLDSEMFSLGDENDHLVNIPDGPIFEKPADDRSPKFDEYDEQNAFRFYLVDHNEDALPYVDRKYMAVCDGLGGSGSIPFALASDIATSFESLKSLILPDAPSEMDNFLLEMWKPLIDSNRSFSSATWGSRIVMARYLHGTIFLHLGDDALKQYILQGLKDVSDFASKPFDVNDLLNGLKPLPTTLVTLTVEEEREDEMDITVRWAGDSRAYILTPINGLQMLSKDNENDNGRMNNLFYAESDTELCIRKYTVPKPCCLMCCSDGIFDPYQSAEHVIEQAFLSLLTYEDINDMQTFGNFIKGYWKSIQSDDISVAFHAYGFKDYSYMKECFMERLGYITEIANAFEENSHLVNLEETKAVYEDLKGKIIARASAKQNQIITELIKCAEEGNIDSLFAGINIQEILHSMDENNLRNREEAIAHNSEIIRKIKAEARRISSAAEMLAIFDNNSPLASNFVEYRELVKEKNNLSERIGILNEKVAEISKEAVHNFNQYLEEIRRETHIVRISIPYSYVLSNKNSPILRIEPNAELRSRYVELDEKLEEVRKLLENNYKAMRDLERSFNIDKNRIIALPDDDFVKMIRVKDDSSRIGSLAAEISIVPLPLSFESKYRKLLEEIKCTLSPNDIVEKRLELYSSNKEITSVADKFFNDATLNQLLELHLKLSRAENDNSFAVRYNEFLDNLVSLIS